MIFTYSRISRVYSARQTLLKGSAVVARWLVGQLLLHAGLWELAGVLERTAATGNAKRKA